MLSYANILEKILGIILKIYVVVEPFFEVNTRHTRLRDVVRELASTMEDMKAEVQIEERRFGKKLRRRRRVVEAYFGLVQGFIESAQAVLDGSHVRQWMLSRMMWVPSIERHLKEGQDLVSKGRELQREGLTYEEIRTRGVMFPIDEDQYMVPSVSALLDSAMQAIQEGDKCCIGIYGYPGSGKTNIMKCLYNRIFQDTQRFKAVFWATAPKFDPDDQLNYHRALQKCVADGMWVDLDDNVIDDEVRIASKINARLQDIGVGRAVLFLDNVEEEFPAYELLGIPSLIAENDSVNCILVLSTLSKDVCNKMRCDLQLKIELLGEEEAKDLFLNEVRRGVNDLGHQRLSNREMRIQETAVKVAQECKRMPLAIIVIARAMVNIQDLPDWNQRLNELTGRITRINEEEDVILEQLKFGYLCLKDDIVKRCFVEAARELANDRQVSKGELIAMWRRHRLINRQGNAGIDQGHTILNQLERMCFIQIASDHQTVTMNKWIWKMADKVSREIA